jgi:hypothetical protein
MEPTDGQELSTEQLIESQETYMLATGQTMPFLEHLDAYQEDSQVEKKTKQLKSTQIVNYAADAPLLSDATHQTIRDYIRKMSKVRGLSNKTIKTHLSSLAVCFEYLIVEFSAVPQDRLKPGPFFVQYLNTKSRCINRRSADVRDVAVTEQITEVYLSSMTSSC